MEPYFWIISKSTDNLRTLLYDAWLYQSIECAWELIDYSSNIYPIKLVFYFTPKYSKHHLLNGNGVKTNK